MTGPLLASDRSTPSESRPSNLRLVLQRVMSDGPISRADIARETGLNPTTVSSLVNELVEDGLIEEVGRAASTGGKPARQLAIRAAAASMIAIDLSSVPLAASRVDLSGATVDSIDAKANGLRGEAAVRAGVDAARTLASASSSPVIGIGIVSPGVVAPSGEVVHSIHRDWRGVHVGQIFNDKLDIPAYVVNDHQAAALVEYGSNVRDARNLIVVLVGEGVGAGLILNGQLHRGDKSGAGELGHMLSPAAGSTPCGCGAQGCLETVVGLPGIVRVARRNGLDAAEGIAGWNAVVTTAEAGGPAAVAAIRDAGAALGQELADVLRLLDVHETVIVGDIRRAGDMFLLPLKDRLDARLSSSDLGDVRVSYGSGQRDLLLQGAAAVVLNASLGVLWVDAAG